MKLLYRNAIYLSSSIGYATPEGVAEAYLQPERFTVEGIYLSFSLSLSLSLSILPYLRLLDPLVESPALSILSYSQITRSKPVFTAEGLGLKD